MAEQTMPVWLGAAFPFLFVASWVAVCTLLGRMGGWARLAETYGTSAVAVRGARFPLRSGSFGWVSYRSVLMLEAGPLGLSFRMLLPYRVGHPPFAVPWEEIGFADRRRWLIRNVELSFARSPGVRVTLSRRLAEQLAEAGGVSSRLPPG